DEVHLGSESFIGQLTKINNAIEHVDSCQEGLTTGVPRRYLVWHSRLMKTVPGSCGDMLSSTRLLDGLTSISCSWANRLRRNGKTPEKKSGTNITGDAKPPILASVGTTHSMCCGGLNMATLTGSIRRQSSF